MHALLNRFSLSRMWAMMRKEFIQLRRDSPTFAMLLGIPLLQLVLFGFAIDNNPRHLPTLFVSADNSMFTRTLQQSIQNTGYFQFIKGPNNEKQAREWLATNKLQFIIYAPADFSRQLIRNEKPTILLEADATDPAATGNAVSAINNLMLNLFTGDTKNLSYLSTASSPTQFKIHLKYNPEGITQYNIVPGLLGVVLTMTMVMITTLAITRERETGTMEMLLATPLQPLEVMTGKILPYILLGYIQAIIILLAAYFIFHVPILGNVFLLLLAILPFIFANLALGLMFSTYSQNQLQAVQLSFFFFLPSILLSGFMFPFRGMPEWAQILGNMLPLTHFLLIVRGIMLKGNGWQEIWSQLIPIVLFGLAVILLGFKRYRRTVA